MLFTPSTTCGMWDTWCFFHKGIHHLFYLHRTRPDITSDGISLAISNDGVHWKEIGEILHKAEDAENMGSGSVWEVDGRFVMNFSETRGGVQDIFFAVSDNLFHWARLGNEYRFSPDPRWYKTNPAGRWDGIWAIKNEDGSYTGFFTAVPETGDMGIQESIGMAHSKDGIKWEALPPPVFKWGKWGNLRTWEVGAVEKIGNKYWMMMGANESVLGCRFSTGLKRKEEIGMFVYSAKNLNRPFYAEPKSWRFLTCPCDRFLMTYFARFYRVQNELLINHHSIEPPVEGKPLVFARSWMAPLKAVKLTKNQCLLPVYWKGNETLKGSTIDSMFKDIFLWPEFALKCDIKKGHNFLELVQPNAGAIAMSGKYFNLEKGIIIEGELKIQKIKKPFSSAGIVIETEKTSKGTVALINSNGLVEIGDILAAIREEPSITRIIRYDAKKYNIKKDGIYKFRIFIRHCFIELYIDNILIQCYTMSQIPTGRIGWVVESGKAHFLRVKAWEITL
ncbi:MAG TPA: hypothetical protein PLI50_03140 [bacterium]|nr:hypothetical protein [bacterium]HPC29192.1 hypothetical protein [bacterium]HRV04710.1 hypothetical protein [Candidatus Ratteibacteria bacterium]